MMRRATRPSTNNNNDDDGDGNKAIIAVPTTTGVGSLDKIKNSFRRKVIAFFNGGAVILFTERICPSFVRHLDDGTASISWPRLCRILLCAILFLQIGAITFFHRAMYSPLNYDSATMKQHLHDQALRNAQHYINTTTNNNNNNMKVNTLQHLLFNDTVSSNAASSSSSSSSSNSSSSSSFSIVIITTQRRRRYLDVLLWSLLEGNNHRNDDNWNTIPLSIINAQRPPSDHIDLPKWMRLLPKNVRFVNATVPHKNYPWRVQGVWDYLDALRECRRRDRDWCIVLEEDLLATRDFVDKFERAVPRTFQDTAQCVGMVKIFVTDYYDGFSSDWKHVQDTIWMVVASFLGMILLFSSLPVLKRRRRRRQQQQQQQPTTPFPTIRQTRRKQMITTLVLFGGIYGACRIVGRQTLVHHFWEPSRIHIDEIVKDTPGTQGIAYPQSTLPNLLSFIQTRLESHPENVENIDILLNRWIFGPHDGPDHILRAFRVRPSLVQHMGAYSSANYKNQGGFESLKQDSTFVVD